MSFVPIFDLDLMFPGHKMERAWAELWAEGSLGAGIMWFIYGGE